MSSPIHSSTICPSTYLSVFHVSAI
jgi:hypothetical protein